ncbi:5-formyltetrahydrofolate cyclo-ligase [Gallibacterium anatis]|uniref:5-formyltetrahydrofolate cyclo-ligase n=1 Tax=Gallibacterium anatis TaxID=750 RepID=UPI00254F1C00|nr:5-formyltetrahydrofolate cyclo-ligase [Gallibacterium anatis]MDK9561803.1 5-formyltetrahydrofolate cyclo-ligase [Gallibacterium anatis]
MTIQSSFDFSSSKFHQRQQLRQFIRQQRATLTLQQQKFAEQKIAQIAVDFLTPLNVKNIAVYLSFDGEISTNQLIETLWRQGYHLYLPVLHPFSEGNLLFLAYTPTTKLIKNKFNILEPKLDVRQVLPAEQLDIIFTPLVAFDLKKNRLGMGGGFYDRTLENWQNKPFLPVGLAHRCQQVEHIPTEDWDMPLFEILAV